MKLSPHFYLSEFTRSDIAERRGIDNTPERRVIENLRYLTEHYLEPIRAASGAPMFITSGYRCPKLNHAVKGSRTSAHMLGLAADFVSAKLDERELFELIQTIQFRPAAFDQLIYEFSWVHLGIVRTPRRQVFEINPERQGR